MKYFVNVYPQHHHHIFFWPETLGSIYVIISCFLPSLKSLGLLRFYRKLHQTFSPEHVMEKIENLQLQIL